MSLGRNSDIIWTQSISSFLYTHLFPFSIPHYMHQHTLRQTIMSKHTLIDIICHIRQLETVANQLNCNVIRLNQNVKELNCNLQKHYKAIQYQLDRPQLPSLKAQPIKKQQFKKSPMNSQDQESHMKQQDTRWMIKELQSQGAKQLIQVAGYFKQDAARKIKTGQRSIQQTASIFDRSTRTIRRWIVKYEQDDRP